MPVDNAENTGENLDTFRPDIVRCGNEVALLHMLNLEDLC